MRKKKMVMATKISLMLVIAMVSSVLGGGYFTPVLTAYADEMPGDLPDFSDDDLPDVSDGVLPDDPDGVLPTGEQETVVDDSIIKEEDEVTESTVAYSDVAGSSVYQLTHAETVDGSTFTNNGYTTVDLYGYDLTINGDWTVTHRFEIIDSRWAAGSNVTPAKVVVNGNLTSSHIIKIDPANTESLGAAPNTYDYTNTRLIINGNLTLTGSAKITSGGYSEEAKLRVTGDVKCNANAEFAADCVVTGNMEFDGFAKLSGSCTAGGNVIFKGNATCSGGGGGDVTGNLTHASAEELTGYWTVTGNVTQNQGAGLFSPVLGLKGNASQTLTLQSNSFIEYFAEDSTNTGFVVDGWLNAGSLDYLGESIAITPKGGGWMKTSYLQMSGKEVTINGSLEVNSVADISSALGDSFRGLRMQDGGGIPSKLTINGNLNGMASIALTYGQTLTVTGYYTATNGLLSSNYYSEMTVYGDMTISNTAGVYMLGTTIDCRGSFHITSSSEDADASNPSGGSSIYDLTVGGNLIQGDNAGKLSINYCNLPNAGSVVTLTKGTIRKLELAYARSQYTITPEPFVDENYDLIAPVQPTAASVNVALNMYEAVIEKGNTMKLVATVTPDSLSDDKKGVTWKSSKTSVATVDASGNVTAKGIGTATITATSTYNKNKKATCKVTVKEKVVAVTGISLLETTKEMSVGELWQPGEITDYNLVPADTTERKVVWTSNRPQVVEVVANGIAAKSAGTATLTATVTSYTGTSYTATCEITVKPLVVPVNRVTLSQNAINVTEGDPDKILTAYLNPADATDQTVTWSSSDTEKRVIELAQDAEDGFKAAVKIKGAGTATVTVTAADGKTATCLVTVAAREITHGDPGDEDHHDDTEEYGKLSPEEQKGLWIAAESVPEYGYTGLKHTPEVRVYDGTKLLTRGTDYTLTWKNNVKAYTLKENDPGFNAAKAPTVTVKLKGNYSGSLSEPFIIRPADISETGGHTVDIAVSSAAYKANMKLPAPVVTVNGKKLKLNTDYTLAYQSPSGVTVTNGKASEPGIYTVTVIGKENGNYTGSAEAKFHLVDTAAGDHTVLMSAVTVKAVKNVPFDAAAAATEAGIVLKNDETGYVVTYAADGTTHTLVPGTKEGTEGDFYVTYLNNKAIGKATLVLTGKDSAGTGGFQFVGEKRVTFGIGGTKLTTKNVQISGIADKDYTGKPVTQDGMALSLKLADGSTQSLVKDTDYAVEYRNHINAGKATVMITGKGGYTGSVKKTFRINKVDLNTLVGDPAALVDTVEYRKGGVKPVPVIEFGEGADKIRLVNGRDFTLKYSNSAKVAAESDTKAPTVTVTGKGNFAGTLTDRFSITQGGFSTLTITAADKPYSTKKNAWMSAPVVTDKNGKVLKANVDYEKPSVDDYSYVGLNWNAPPKPGQTVTVTVKGKGNYKDETLTTSYRIFEKNLSKATIVIVPQTYDTGREITLTQDSFAEGKCYFGKGAGREELILGEDFYVVSYSRNVEKGTATVILQGMGDYGNTKTVKFKINAKKPGNN